MRKQRAHISSLEQEVKPAPQLAEALRRAVAEAPPLSAEIETERRGFDARSRAADASGLAIQTIRDAIAYLASAPDYITKIEDSISTIVEQDQPDTTSLVASLERAKDALQTSFFAAKDISTSALAEEHNALRQAFESKDEPFFRLRKQQSDVNESLKKQQNLRRQVEHMQKLERDLLASQEETKSLLKRRAEIRANISILDDKILEIRTGEIKSINDDHGDFVYLTLKQGSGSSSYAIRLENLLKQSKIRGQDEIAKALAHRFQPHELIDIIEAGDSQTLAKSLDKDVAQMTRVISHLVDHADLHNIESEPPAARLEITMYDGGQAKPIETLSKGQKATALLPLILRPLPYPLILDQPEDDLDNSFIITYLVKTITRLKLNRQLIFITHNANIPVLGDADHVVVMGMKTPTQAIVRKSGTVDECKKEILDLLEGGATAFLQREVRYGELLTGVSDGK